MLVEHSRAREGATAASTVKVGIVGAGYVAAHHLRAVRDLPFTRVVAIADPDAEKAQRSEEHTSELSH